MAEARTSGTTWYLRNGKRKKKGLPGGSDCKESGLGSTPGSGRSPGEGNGNPLQYSFLENSMDRGAW